ncbi:glycosyltransferase family 39 protein [Patescibacteria group bacterium]|nr:glycosyltransferase family 39 protein [Patescibacteria group bacterium]
MKLISKLKNSKAIIVILLVATTLRLYKLCNLPISLFGDEIDVGYHAWSLITTGRDYMGNLLPTYIQSLSEWRAPLLMYITAPFVGILGPTPFAVRLPITLLGVLNIYLVYLLANKLFKNKSLGLISALILSLTPWHIHYSRAAFESTLLLTLLLSGTLFFIKKRYPLSIISFILTFYTYSTANLFTPLLVLSLFLIYRPPLTNLLKRSFTLFGLYFILLLPIAYHLTLGQAAGRFSLISVFSDQEIVYDIVNQRTAAWVDQNAFTEKLFHNKAISYAGKIGSNYLSAFSPQFLFISGDPNFRHSIGRFGELLWATSPFLVLGFVVLIKKINNKENKLILAWLLLSPIPSALTSDGSLHATRLILTLPPLIIISALGIHQVFVWLKISLPKWNLFFAGVFVIATTINITAYWHRYSTHYKFESARHWQHGYKEIFQKTIPYLDSANRIFINNTYEPSLIKFAFFAKYPPKKFQQNFTTDIPEENIVKGFSGFKFADKFYFGKARNLDDLFRLLEPGDIYLAVQGQEVPGDWDWSKEPPENTKILNHTKDVFNNPLFYLVTPK